MFDASALHNIARTLNPKKLIPKTLPLSEALFGHFTQPEQVADQHGVRVMQAYRIETPLN